MIKIKNTFITFLVAILLIFCCCTLMKSMEKSIKEIDANDILYDATVYDDIEQLKKYDKPMVIVFGADYCSTCINYEPYIEKINTIYNDELIVKYIDVAKNESIRSAFNIELIPSTLFYNADGSAFIPDASIDVYPSEEQFFECKYTSSNIKAKTGKELSLNDNYEYGIDENGKLNYCKFVGLLDMTQLHLIIKDMIK